MAKKENLVVKTEDQLATQLSDLKREQFNLRFQAATNQLEKPSRVREVRRTIARIKTLQSDRARASSLALWCRTRVTRRSWSVSSGG
jgi:large subunit ribosomal protein L29